MAFDATRAREVVVSNLARWMRWEPDVADAEWMRELASLGHEGIEARGIIRDAREPGGILKTINERGGA